VTALKPERPTTNIQQPTTKAGGTGIGRWALVVGCWTLIPVFVLLSLSGCLGYRLGSTLPPGIRTVDVPTFINDTAEPLLEIETTRAVMREFRKDGTLRVTRGENADSVLHVRLVRYALQPLRYERDRARTVSEYRLSMRAKITFERADTGEILVKRTVKGESTFATAGDLTSSKQAALPAASRDLAHNIVECVVEYW